jgi:beta-phosphoglucomutase-like phosphatase (HAD superfamily)
MVALAKDRITPQRAGLDFGVPVAANAKIYAGALVVLGAAGTAAAGKLESGLQRAGSAVGWLANRYTALGGVLAFGAVVHQVNKMEEGIERLAGELDRPIERMRELNKELDRVAGRRDIVIETGSLRAAAVIIARATKDVDFIQANAPTIGRALQVAGPEKEADVAQMFVGIQRQGIKDPKAVAHTLDRLFAQSKLKGSPLSFVDVLGSGASTAALQGSGRSGEEGLMEWGAVLQTAMKGTGRGGGSSPEHARMATKAFFHDLQSTRTKSSIETQSVPMVDSKGRPRPLADLVLDMMRHKLGSQEAMEMAGFSEESQGILKPWAEEYKQTGDVKSLREQVAAQGAGGLAAESAKNAKLPAVKERRHLENIKKASAKHLGPTILKAEEMIDALLEGRTDDAAKAGEEMLNPLRKIISHAGTPAPATSPTRSATGLRRFFQPISFGAADAPAPGAKREAAAPPAAPEGRVTIEVRAAPGTQARVVGKPQAKNMELEVDSGQIMRGP